MSCFTHALVEASRKSRQSVEASERCDNTPRRQLCPEDISEVKALCAGLNSSLAWRAEWPVAQLLSKFGLA